MDKRKLLIGLAATGAFGAGFGTLPATAQLRIFAVTLISGQTVTVQAEAPAGTPAADVTLPIDEDLVETVTEITTAGASTPDVTPTTPTQTAATAEEPPTTTAELPTTETAPTEAGPGQQTGEQTTDSEGDTEQPSDPAADPATNGEQQPADAGDQTITPAPPQPSEEITDAQRRAKRQKEREEPGRLHGTRAQQEEEVASGRIRTEDGAPTVNNPTMVEVFPGPAPIGVPNFFIDKFRIPPFLLPIYQAAGIEYGVRWEILAAINEIETDYGRNLNVSSAGALGWMQFMPSTWKAYGVDANHDDKKDPYNPVDAIFAAARYLKAAGAETDIRKAIFAYNHADWYVDSVLMRARLIGGMPSDLIGSLTGLTQGRFPVDGRAVYADDITEQEYERKVEVGQNAAVPVDADADRREIGIFAKAGTAVIATQDATVVKISKSERLGRYIRIRDVYGNSYTYGNLGKIAQAYGTPKPKPDVAVSDDEVRKELKLPDDPQPTAPATAGSQADNSAAGDDAGSEQTSSEENPSRPTVPLSKLRVFANPERPSAAENGGGGQVRESGGSVAATPETTAAYAEVLGLKPEEIDVKPLRVGARIAAGTVLGEIGDTTPDGPAPHLQFEIRPAGRGAPRIDPKPILDGWQLLESTAIYRAAGKNPFFGPDAKHATIGQILLMNKETLQRRVLTNPKIEIYSCGRDDIRAGLIDRRVLASLEFLAASGLKPTVSALQCGHGFYTAGGNVSAHSSGNAVDIAAINDIPIVGNQGAGSVTDMTIRRLLTLQGNMKPQQIISLMTFDGADNTLSMPDHADHIHIGWKPHYDPRTRQGRKAQQVLKPSQWIKLISQINKIDNPTVLTSPSQYALDAKSQTKIGKSDKTK